MSSYAKIASSSAASAASAAATSSIPVRSFAATGYTKKPAAASSVSVVVPRVRPERKSTAFCSVCKNSGKTEAEYTSHYTKSSDGMTVICPTILTTTCTYCKTVGHFKNACPILAKKNKMDIGTGARGGAGVRGMGGGYVKTEAAGAGGAVAGGVRGMFASLEDDCDSACDSADEFNATDFPAMAPAPVKASPVVAGSYANMLAKPAPIVEAEPVKTVNEKAEIFKAFMSKKDIHHSWADDSYWASSDDEEW